MRDSKARTSLSARLLLCLAVGGSGALTLATSSCGSAPVAAAGDAKSARVAPRVRGRDYVTPATVFASTEPESVSVMRVEADGRKLLVSHGMRMVQHRDGSLDRASELLPAKDAVRIAALPPRLGGGYLFYVSSNSATMIWSAQEFTGKLKPLANLDFAVERIVPGFDRLYLMRARTRFPLAIDAISGEALELGPLPPSPSYDEMAFADAWMGVVAVPLRGVLASFDAGASWHTVPDATRVVDTELGPVVRTNAGWGLLTQEGVLRRWESPDDDAQKLDQMLETISGSLGEVRPETDETQRTPPRPLGRDPLRAAILHGVLGPSGSAYVAHLGALARVRLDDGAILELARDAFPANAECRGIRLGAGFGFVCSEERGRTTVYSLEMPLSLRTVMAFAGPRYVADNERGGLVVRGRCSEEAPEPGYYCLKSEHGLREIRVRGDVGAERVALYADGSAAVIVPPRKGAHATLTRVDLEGQSHELRLRLPKSGPVANLIREGIWLEGFSETSPGEFVGWVAGAGPFVGIRIKRDGTVEAGEVQNDIERAMLSGRFALLLAQYGHAQQSVDGGFNWIEVPTLQAPDSPQGPAASEQGCSPIGCVTPEWLRVGWSRPEEKPKDSEVEPPERTHIPSPGGGRWTMHCYATGVASPRALPAEGPDDASERVRQAMQRAVLSRLRAIGGTTAPTNETTGWQPFFEERAPRLPTGQLGFGLDVEYDAEHVHAYVWGQRGADWGRTGGFLVRVLDRFQVPRGVWSSEQTKSPWPDELSAAAAFGQGASGGSSSWQFELEPSGREGILLVRQQTQTQLFVVSEGRGVTPIRGADAVVRTSGVVRLGSSWHFGAPTVDGFAVYEIVGDQVALVKTYPLDESRSSLNVIPRLIRSSDGDALAISLETIARYIFPINALDGALGAPITIAPAELANLPPVCDEAENGFVFTDALRIAPYVELMGAAGAVNASHVEGRFTATATNVCVDALAARASAVLPESLARLGQNAPKQVERAPVPMVLSEQGTASRRWEFACYP